MFLDKHLHQQETMNSNKKGQIMVITLIVLMILGVVIVGLIILINRDTGQVTSNKKSQQIYNVAETELLAVVSEYADPSISLTNIPNCVQTTTQNAGIKFDCEATDEALDGNLTITTKLDIEETKQIENLEIRKDQTFTMNLDGYNSTLTFDWDRDAAVEFTVTFFDDNNLNGVWDTGETLESKTGVYDTNSILYENSGGSSDITFGNLGATQTSLNISTISNLPAKYRAYNLSITPRLTQDTLEAVIFDITPSNFNTIPRQMRIFTATSFDATDSDTPVQILNSQVPLYPQLDSIFNYSLITKDSIDTVQL